MVQVGVHFNAAGIFSNKNCFQQNTETTSASIQQKCQITKKEKKKDEKIKLK